MQLNGCSIRFNSKAHDDDDDELKRRHHSEEKVGQDETLFPLFPASCMLMRV